MRDQAYYEAVNRCVSEIRAGDKESVSRLHILLGRTPYFVALRFLKNEEKACDLVQDFWCDIYNIVNKMPVVHKAYKYLCVSIENMARMTLRRGDAFCGLNEFETVHNEQIDLLVEDAEFNALHNALWSLPTEERDVISLIYFERKTVRAAAQILHRSKSSVERIKQRAIVCMRVYLEKHGWDRND